eukprot:1192674-Prorocentrum_minimum.AAC.4
MLAPLHRVAPDSGICSLPSIEWRLTREYARSPPSSAHRGRAAPLQCGARRGADHGAVALHHVRRRRGYPPRGARTEPPVPLADACARPRGDQRAREHGAGHTGAGERHGGKQKPRAAVHELEGPAAAHDAQGV